MIGSTSKMVDVTVVDYIQPQKLLGQTKDTV